MAAFIRFRPYGDLLSMYGKINKLFEEDLMREGQQNQVDPNCWVPATDIYETSDGYVFKVELPGISKEDIKVELNGDNLSIKGERKEEKEVKKEEYHRIERICGSFSRTFQLPKNADGKKIIASMKDGILELRIPKEEQSITKAIPISIK
jgi:HSP20 family protein